MSDRFVRRLERVRDEFVAARGALAYVSLQWSSDSLYNFSALETVGIEDVRRAAEDLEATYIIRLFSAFEGILKEHLAQSHSNVCVAEDASAAFLIDRVSRLQTPRFQTPFWGRVYDVRRYRNFLVHPGGGAPDFVAFPDAVARLSRFVNRLPDLP